jgi:hypothetical protein
VLARAYGLLFAVSLVTSSGAARAVEPPAERPAERPELGAEESREASTGPTAPKGHPTVVLDRLDLSKTPGAILEEKFLREVLAREVKKLDWGAGRGSRIEYRLALEELSVTEGKNVVHVTCGARGWLPKGRKANSRLTFGGPPQDRRAVVRHVLEIVARGVVTRLAELERKRRNEAGSES